MALKSCYYLSGTEIQNICKELNIDEDYFTSLINKAKETLTRKEKVYTSKRKKANELYITKNEVLERIKTIESDYYEKNLLTAQYKYLNSLWSKKMEEKNSTKINPPNKIIADLLNTTCYKVNKVLKDIEKNVIENS